jgi:hypothetical protein
MLQFIDAPAARYLASAVFIALGVGLQFLPLFDKRLVALAPRFAVLKVLRYRMVQLVLGFGLLSVGVELLRMQ